MFSPSVSRVSEPLTLIFGFGRFADIDMHFALDSQSAGVRSNTSRITSSPWRSPLPTPTSPSSKRSTRSISGSLTTISGGTLI